MPRCIVRSVTHNWLSVEAARATEPFMKKMVIVVRPLEKLEVTTTRKS